MGECEEIPLEQKEVRSCFLGRGSKCRVCASGPECRHGPGALHWPGWMWLGTNASASLMPFWESPPGLLWRMGYFFLTSQQNRPENHNTEQDTETSLSFYLITAIVLWDPSCSCSTTTQGFTPHGKSTIPGFWQCSFSREQSPPGDALQPSTPPAQGESLRVGSGLQQKLCSRSHVCEPTIWLCLASVQHLWLPRPGGWNGCIPLFYLSNTSCRHTWQHGIARSRRQSLLELCHKQVLHTAVQKTSP